MSVDMFDQDREHPLEAGDPTPGRDQLPVPERRSVKWAEALAAIAIEIIQKQGNRRAEILLRAVGGRMAKDMLGSFGGPISELEAAINRALAILDWGWTAIIEVDEIPTFEHRAPLPFQKRPDQLPLVLEGFYSEILHGLGLDPALQVRFLGIRAGALIFQFLPPDWAVNSAGGNAGPGISLPSLRPGERMPGTGTDLVRHAGTKRLSQADVFSALENLKSAKPGAPEAKRLDRPEPPRAPPMPEASPQPASRKLPPLPASIDPLPVAPASAPAGYSLRTPSPQMSVLMVAGLVFVILFALGVLASGDLASEIFDSFTRDTPSDSAASGSIEGLERRARNGDNDAQIQLALRLADGRRGGADYTRAARWLQMAASSGVAEAQYDLGVLTERGLGVARDDVGAAIQYLGAAGQGFAPAEYRIGLAYAEGRGVSQSYPDAANWFDRAARQGIRQAQFDLGSLYARGNGVAPDEVAAYAWFRLAEENGDREAAEQRSQLEARMPTDQVEAAHRSADQLIGDIGSGLGARGPVVPTTIDTVIDRTR